jgi:hypothetical protein
MRNLSLAIMLFMTVPVTVLRGLALQNILQKNATQDKRWLYWRGKFSRDILNCNNRAVEPCASRIL